MIANVKKMACGGCGDRLHRLYKSETGELLVECSRCKAVTCVSVATPALKLENIEGDGNLAPFAGDDN